MKAFNYRARSEGGEPFDGVVEANTREEALTSLREGGLIVESISEANSLRDIDLRLGNRKTKEKSLSIMCNQFAIILQTGIPIVRTLELIANQTDDKTLRKILQDVAGDVSAGYGLADSFAKHGSGLPTTFIETIRAGEQSGNLDVVFRRLSRYYEKTSRTKAKVKSAMVYPAFIGIIAIIVIFVIMVFAVPTFSSTFEGMGSELPLITRALIASSHFMASWWWAIALAIVLVAVGIKLAKRNERFRLFWSSLGLRIPVLGRINLMDCSSRYASTMSVMMEAGLSVVKSVEVTAKSMSNYFMSSQLLATQEELESGKQLAACLAKTEVFPELVTEMTGVGEQTGSLESTLDVLSEYYDNEVEMASQRALSIMEPVMIVFLAVIVCVILLAVYLPMFSMYGSM